MDLSPKEARKAAIVDNVRSEPHWLAQYIAIEEWLALDGDLNQQEAADLVMKDPSALGKGLKLLKLLSFSARQGILENLQNPDSYDLPEACALRLRELATGRPDDQSKLESVLKVILVRSGLW